MRGEADSEALPKTYRLCVELVGQNLARSCSDAPTTSSESTAPCKFA
jgi:hypothetical protein